MLCVLDDLINYIILVGVIGLEKKPNKISKIKSCKNQFYVMFCFIFGWLNDFK